MKKIVKNAIRRTASVPALRGPLARGFTKANAYFSAVANDKMRDIYVRNKQYTRVPPEMFIANLEVLEQFSDVEGLVVECGVWRGGMSAGMADLLGPERAYHLFDSFEGLPDAKGIDGQRALDWQEAGEVDNCRAEEHYAQEAMERSNAAKFELHKGWFSDTLPKFKPAEPIAVLRLDGDWYSSTAECLNYLYPLVRKGGLILIDDYFAWTGCSRAVHDYLSANALADRIQSEDTMLGYMVKREDKECIHIDPEREM